MVPGGRCVSLCGIAMYITRIIYYTEIGELFVYYSLLFVYTNISVCVTHHIAQSGFGVREHCVTTSCHKSRGICVRAAARANNMRIRNAAARFCRQRSTSNNKKQKRNGRENPLGLYARLARTHTHTQCSHLAAQRVRPISAGVGRRKNV